MRERIATMPEQLVDAITISFISILFAATPFVVAWFRARTNMLERLSNDIKQTSEVNTQLLEKNTKLTESIERHSNGMSEKIAAIAATNAFAAGRISGKRSEGAVLDEKDRLELEEYESAIGRSIVRRE